MTSAQLEAKAPNLSQFKSCMLASLRSLLPKASSRSNLSNLCRASISVCTEIYAVGKSFALQEWDTQYEVAWNWLWDNVAQLLASSPAMRCRVLMSTLPSWLMADPIFNEISMKCYVLRSKLWEHPTRGRPGPLMQLHAGLPSGHMTP